MEWVPIVFVVFKALVLCTGMFFAIKWHYDQDRQQDRETGEPQPPSEIRLFTTVILSLGLSLIGIVYAGCWGDPGDGGRGGALSCALVFFMACMSFMSRPTAEAALPGNFGQASHAQGDGLAEPDPTKLHTERLRAAFVVRLASVEREKIYLSVASVISTLAWKYGGIAAALIDTRH